jgi:HK97 family phage major capsid protein
MPLGVMTRLVQTEVPTGYPATARAWADLHTSNVVSITAANSTGLKLFQNLVTASGAAKGKYARGAKTWVMNETTRTKLIAEGLAVNAAGAIVSGVNGSMPVIGGDIEVLEFIPDNVIIGGYFELYLLAERSTTRLSQSEHYRFVEDQTVFKGTARYDGTPVIPEAFVAIGIGGTTPNATMTFAADTANA